MINPPPPTELVAELGRFRHEIAAIEGQSSVAWQTRPSADDWSLSEVMCHLRDVEREVHQIRIEAVLQQENAFLAGVDPDQWAGPREYCFQDGPLAQTEFLEARDETIAGLSSLPQEAWERVGQHTYFGPTSLQELAYLIVQHDRLHSKQIANLIDGSQS